MQDVNSTSAHGERRQVTAEVEGQQVPVLANRVIVQMKMPPAGTADVDAASAFESALSDVTSVVTGGRVLRRSAIGRVVIDAPAGAELDVAQVAASLSERDDVEYAEPDVIDHACITPNDTRYVDQWSPGKVNAEAAWDLETGDANVVIGIIDSGISMTSGVLDHGDLNDTTRITLGTDFVDGGEPRDLNGHGTHVAGISAAPGNNGLGIAGMNWGSSVYICRTLDVNGNGSSADFADAVEEITDWAIANGLKAVINYSGGGGDNMTKRSACQYASDNGMILCAATGNDNFGPVIFPAAYSTTIPGVIAVGATDSNDAVAGFSNVGPEVTVVAPGDNIFSTMPTYAVTLAAGPDFGTLDGTSMATPLVSGLCALMWSRHPTFTNAKIKQCLSDTAVKLGPRDFDNAWGHGRVDADAALKCGDAIIVKTIIGPTCPGIESRIVRCPPVSRLVICGQPSVLPRLCPTSLLPNDCVVSFVSCPSRVACPSLIDACPSALVECQIPGRPDMVINPGRFGPPVVRPGELAGPPGRFEVVRGEATIGRANEVWYDTSGRYWGVPSDG